MSRLTESQNVLIYLLIPVNDSEFEEKKRNKKKKLLCTELYARSLQSLSLKKIASFPCTIARGDQGRTVKNRVFEWKRDLSSSDWHGQEVMGNRIHFLGQAFDRVVVCARARAGKECRMQPFHGEIFRPWQNAAGWGSGRLNGRCYKL